MSELIIDYNLCSTRYLICKQSCSTIVNKLFKTGYQHCFVLWHDNYNWISFNPQKRYPLIEILPYDPKDNVVKLCTSQGYFALKIDYYTVNPDRFLFGYGLATCTTLCQYVLGVNMRAWTPWGLFRRLEHADQTRLSRQGIRAVTRIL